MQNESVEIYDKRRREKERKRAVRGIKFRGITATVPGNYANPQFLCPFGTFYPTIDGRRVGK